MMGCAWLALAAAVVTAVALADPQCYAVESSTGKYGFSVSFRDCHRSEFSHFEIAHALWDDTYNTTGWWDFDYTPVVLIYLGLALRSAATRSTRMTSLRRYALRLLGCNHACFYVFRYTSGLML
jgi:hypothetical protein